MYLIDAYGTFSASALGFLVLARFVVAGGVTVAGGPIYQSLGVQYTLNNSRLDKRSHGRRAVPFICLRTKNQGEEQVCGARLNSSMWLEKGCRGTKQQWRKIHYSHNWIIKTTPPSSYTFPTSCSIERCAAFWSSRVLDEKCACLYMSIMPTCTCGLMSEVVSFD